MHKIFDLISVRNLPLRYTTETSYCTHGLRCQKRLFGIRKNDCRYSELIEKFEIYIRLAYQKPETTFLRKIEHESDVKNKITY